MYTNPIKFFIKSCPKLVKWIFINGIIYGIASYSMLLATSNFGKIIDEVSKNPKEIPYTNLILFLVCLLFYEYGYRSGHIIENFILRININKFIKESLFKVTMKQNFGYFADRFAGGISYKVGNITRGYLNLQEVFTNRFLANITLIIVTIITLININVYLALILFIWVIFFILGLIPITKKMNFHSEKYALEENNTISLLSDIYTNISSVKIYSNNFGENLEFNIQNEIEYKAYKKFSFYEIILFHYQGISGIILFSIFIGLGYYLFFKGFISLGDFVLILGISLRLFWTVWEMGPAIASWNKNYSELKQLLSDILVTPDFGDRESALTLEDKNNYSIKFKNINYSYIDGKEVLKDFNLSIKPGEKVGIVGPSGSGKTTLVNLLLRFYEVNNGEVLIDGINIKDFSQDSLRKQITSVSQDTTLFHRSILENIRYSKKDASLQEVIKASKDAGAFEFIENLPDKFDTLVGDRGIKLSGGQRQRIAIARAMLKNAPIFLLDEATSALDSESEKKVQEALHTLIDGKTVIAIAHRLSTLLSMDRIIVMKDGKVLESGNHSELLENNGLYRKLWDMQAGGFIPEIEI
ncbi:MAG: ABC transporter ATP-binding protein [Candidatus Gracilibacteria bacterium]|nr:ABC transporter ATP-binding protein [Candidatus Gracilibacteria bacterium]